MAEQNSYDFWTRYSNLCLKCKVCPLKSVIKHMRGTALSCPVERIRSEHWQFLLSALSIDNSLTEVCFKSDLPLLEEQKELWKKRRRKLNESYPIPYGYSPQNISDICKYSARLLTVSQTLQILILENLPITKEDAEHLAEGLKATFVKEFAFRCYPHSNDVIEIVCRGLWDSRVSLLDFSACNLSQLGLQLICNVIKKHKSRRTIEVFPETLRYRLPVFEDMIGLKRVNLNGNNIGDKGAEFLCDTVSYDSWIQALDLQCCGITNEGAISFLKVVTANNSIQLIDLRLNDIDNTILERITMQLGLNGYGKSMTYSCLPLWKPRLLNKSLPVRKNKIKTKVMKKYSKASAFKKDTRGFEPALRISYEIFDNKDVGMEDVAVQTNASSDFINLQEKVRSLEKRLCQEMQMRDSLMDVMDKLKSENTNLRHEVIKISTYDDVILIDQETYAEIKHVFGKFQRFLQLMKEYGLWGLASAIGVAEYENTQLEAVPSESKVCMVEKEIIPVDDHLTNGPVNSPVISKPQTRCCSCLKPECISNQKAEKENNASNLNHIPKNQDKSRLKNIVDKAKITFKEFRETYTNSELTKQQLPAVPPFTRKLSTGDIMPNTKYTKPSPFKSVSNSDIPSKFKHIKTRRELYEAMKMEFEKPDDGIYEHDKIPQSPGRGNFFPWYQNVMNSKSSLKNVSSQTVAVDSIANYKCKKVNPVSLSGSASSVPSQKSVYVVSNPPSVSKSFSTEDYAQEAVRKVSQEWKEHVKRNFPECDASHVKTTSNTESSANPIVDPGYFKASQVQPNQTSVESEISQSSSKTNASDQNVKDMHSASNQTAHQPFVNSTSTANRKVDPSSVTVSSVSEQDYKSRSSQTSNKSSSNRSYLESVSDASTDKDVKSITETEVYESVKSNSVSSNNSNKSSKKQKSLGGVPYGKSNPNKSTVNDNSSKSSKKNQKQKKNSNQNSTGGGKLQKEKASSSSVPSLSDITTVSSHSLNTNSIMDQLSESGKGLS